MKKSNKIVNIEDNICNKYEFNIDKINSTYNIIIPGDHLI
jgi:hypothetical protein